MLIEVKVIPNSKRAELTKLSENTFKLKVKSPAENNKANLEVIKFFSKYFKKDVEIIKGKTARRKTLRIS